MIRKDAARAGGLVAALAAVVIAGSAAAMRMPDPVYLPDAAASRIVTVVPDGPAETGLTVLTEGVAIKETGPRPTVHRFGEVYAFAPATLIVRREEPTEIAFWNLQPDDDHDLMLVDPDGRVLMKQTLPALGKPHWVFTFHVEGLFTFYCTMHQPAMTGQILVLPARAG